MYQLCHVWTPSLFEHLFQHLGLTILFLVPQNILKIRYEHSKTRRLLQSVICNRLQFMTDWSFTVSHNVSSAVELLPLLHLTVHYITSCAHLLHFLWESAAGVEELHKEETAEDNPSLIRRMDDDSDRWLNQQIINSSSSDASINVRTAKPQTVRTQGGNSPSSR